MTTAKSIALVNNVSILLIEDEQKLVPIKPICEALNIDYSTQSQRLKEDPILSSVVGLNPTTGKDGKTYEMQCLPLKYALGWLFRIDSRNVKEEAREMLVMYQLECYDVLYNHFHGKIIRAKDEIKKKAMLKVQLMKLHEALLDESEEYARIIEIQKQLKIIGNPYSIIHNEQLSLFMLENN